MIQVSSSQKLIAVFIAFISCMISCRIIYSGSWMYTFLLWNIFLAWIPFQLSSLLLRGKKNNLWGSGFLFTAWLLFFPNSLYIITDLIHLEMKTSVPLWYDVVLLFSSASIGLIMAFASLYRIELFFTGRMKNSLVDKLIVGCLFLGSFGVYLGRFLRWNSWDIIADPGQLTTEIIIRFLLPHQHWRTWAITFLFTCFFSVLYFSFKKLPGYLKEPGNSIL